MLESKGPLAIIGFLWSFEFDIRIVESVAGRVANIKSTARECDSADGAQTDWVSRRIAASRRRICAVLTDLP
jgi:transposase-like protein